MFSVTQFSVLSRDAGICPKVAIKKSSGATLVNVKMARSLVKVSHCFTLRNVEKGSCSCWLGSLSSVTPTPSPAPPDMAVSS